MKSIHRNESSRLPADSTILNKTLPSQYKAALSNSRQKKGDEMTLNATNSRCRNKELRQYIKRYLQELSPKPSESIILPYISSIQSILEQLSNVQIIDEFISNDEQSYKSKVGCVTRYKGIPYTIQWITAEEPKPDESHLYDKPLQLVASVDAVNYYYGNSLFGSKIEHALIVVALPNQEAQIFEFGCNQLNHYRQAWQKRLNLFYKTAA
ncbi:hypothetical protein [Floridanema aerugineum]|uniref:Uncharacterized protein n=1 Tax=Floridaenema aerugineum BLCC-F46 TaxID=3153654 RepID=A0ABV4X380_9CYAN